MVMTKENVWQEIIILPKIYEIIKLSFLFNKLL